MLPVVSTATRSSGPRFGTRKPDGLDLAVLFDFQVGGASPRERTGLFWSKDCGYRPHHTNVYSERPHLGYFVRGAVRDSPQSRPTQSAEVGLRRSSGLAGIPIKASTPSRVPVFGEPWVAGSRT